MNLPLLLLRPDLGKKAYRLKCRFEIEAYPTPKRLEQAKIKALEWFVNDMAHERERWEYVPGERVRVRGPFAPVVPISIRSQHSPGSKEMLHGVMQGARYRDGNGTMATSVTPLNECESWEYEIAAVFFRNTILVDVPDRHEEMVGTR